MLTNSLSPGRLRSLAQLYERRRRKLALLVPYEMHLALSEMLDMEPNLRPSASYALQVSLAANAAAAVTPPERDAAMQSPPLLTLLHHRRRRPSNAIAGHHLPTSRRRPSSKPSLYYSCGGRHREATTRTTLDLIRLSLLARLSLHRSLQRENTHTHTN